MISEPAYQEGNSFLHRFHPLTKIALTVSGVILVFLGPQGWICVVLPGLVALILLAIAGQFKFVSKRITRILVPFMVFLFFIHGFFYPGNQNILISLGPFSIGLEGVIYALRVVIKLASALAFSFLLISTTHTGDLIQALTDLGLSNRFAYLIGSPLLLIPQMAERGRLIRVAQQSRGLELGGNLFTRIKALLPIITPLILSSLVDIEERAIALEVRGFSKPGPKTSLRELHDTNSQKLLRWFLFLLTVSLLTAGFIWRKNALP